VTDEPLPIPPRAMRGTVGPVAEEVYENPDGHLVYSYLPPEAYRSVLDFGCGAGRFARLLAYQTPRPERYLGIDLNYDLIEWTQENLEPLIPGFSFQHHNVYNVTLNPGIDKPPYKAFPNDGSPYSLVHALSVFTHLPEPNAEHYLYEARRVLAADGYVNASWFLFDRGDSGAAEISNANTLYVDFHDPTIAVIFDRTWVRDMAARAGFVITHVVPPSVRGFQWTLVMRPKDQGYEEVEIPPDTAPLPRASNFLERAKVPSREQRG
jgi:SAM-dependent methyltransferase